MRYLPLIICMASLCGCYHNKEGATPPEPTSTHVRTASTSTISVDTAFITRRQRLIDRELDYYLQRHNPQDEGFDLVVRYALDGDSSLALYLPKGHLSLSSTLRPLSPGEVIDNKHGGRKFLTRDCRGRLIVGRMLSDTLITGLRIDSLGVYGGTMTLSGEARGHGIYRAADGTYFEGHWEHDQRNGFGLSIGPGHLKVGSWLRDQFRGEHFSYHSDRIYGIDISRYQHERGRRRYPIHWNRLRISHLGRRIGQERVLDERVDYPVSFVYIKSTEGTTIENRYYNDDDAAARSHDIAVGAYHFFSTTTPADEQARHYLAKSHFRKGDLPPMLDIEPSDRKIREMGGPQALFEAVRQWLDIVERATDCRPLLYINQRFANLYLPLAPDLKSDYHFWIARYGEYKPDIHLDIWQLSGDGRVQGITPECDLNVFNGYQAQWDEFLRTQTIP